MADLSKSPEVQQLVAAAVAEASKQLQAEHLKAIEVLKAAASKSAEQQRAEEDCARARAKQRSLREAALEVAKATNSPHLTYVTGPSGHYGNGRHYGPYVKVTKPMEDDPKHLPSIEWTVFDPRAPKVEVQEKKGPITAAEMNKLDAERPKTGVQAPKKGGRPSDTEV